MIPILYEANETDFVSNGIGRLSDAISCKVIEERNGIYELEMEYHIDGIHYNDISEDRLILAKPFDGGTNQAFRIYKISKPLNGVVTVYGEHISYLLNRMAVNPFTAGSCVEAFAQIESNFVASCPFTFWTDKSVVANMNVVEPHAARELLGGMQGSILDVYGKGDYEFDNFLVKFHSNRGSDKGVTLRYGKNLSSMNNENDIQNAYTGVVPYWKDSEDNVLMLSEKVVWSSHRNDYLYPLIKIVDFSQDFDEQPTQAQLRSKANSYLSKNSGWNPTTNIKVSFVALWQTEEYESVANLERVKMCDSVTVIYDRLGVNAKMRVIKTDYDVLKERYNSIELGEASANLAKAVAETDKNLNDTAVEITSEYKKAVAHATKMIQGGLGGHIVFNTDAQGHPNELLIMDTDNKATAVNVWRFNLGGLGHSHSGYDGPFNDVALTADGQINATMITTGYMKADRVRTGLLQSSDSGGNFSLNLNTGKMVVKGANGLTIEAANGLVVEAGNFKIDTTGNVTITGTLTAKANSKIGPWNVTNTSIWYGNANFGNASGLYWGTSGLSITDKFKVTSAGDATVAGTLTAKANSKIGPWNVTNTSIWYGNANFGNASGLYWGTSGLSITDKFKVTSAGDATVAGKITATSGYIGGTTGFTVDSKKLYNGKSTFASTDNGIFIGVDDGISIGNFKGGSRDGTGFRASRTGRTEVGCLYFFTGNGTQTAQYGLWAKDSTHIGSGGPCDFNSENNGWNYLRNNTQTGLLQVKGELNAEGGIKMHDRSIEDVDDIEGDGHIWMDSAKFPNGVNAGGCNLISNLQEQIHSLDDRISALGG